MLSVFVDAELHSARSLSALARPAAEIEDLAQISLRFHHLCPHKLLKLMKILAQTSISSLRRSKSDRLLGKKITQPPEGDWVIPKHETQTDSYRESNYLHLGVSFINVNDLFKVN